ncbi:MAG: twin-arginine translocase subunit TatC [Candidatus Thalassarchaeaceae archaeon]
MRGFIQHLQNRSYAFTIIFIVGFLIGYPISEEIIEWLLRSEGYKPSNVQIIILQPMEVVLLQLQMGTQIGFLLLIFTFIIDIAINSHKIIKRTKRENKYSFNWKIGRIMLITLISLLLAMMGIIYSHEILIPMLLDYLSQDATSSGLSSTWRLKSWITFITGLYFSSIIGFQIPLVTILLIRVKFIKRETILENRRILWFTALLFGALISPPDPLSLFLVGGPMLILLEISLIIEKIVFAKHYSN